ncbi:MAG: hypothetical protein GEV03_22075 [Streptosporangiales bacterium]|nr:hypothetical protein [Streptosporangiales bacterium]
MVACRRSLSRAFLGEVQAWSTGHFRAAYSTPDELTTAVLRALHDYELATAAGAVDEAEMLARAIAMLPDNQASGVVALRG